MALPMEKTCSKCGFTGHRGFFRFGDTVCKECRRKARRKMDCKRKFLGHEPLNKKFKNSDCHHLRYDKNHRNNNLTIYVPRELHRSIPHNGNSGKNMRAINLLALEWYLENTPIDERNPKAIKLYWNYCTLPEPDWNYKTCEA